MMPNNDMDKYVGYGKVHYVRFSTYDVTNMGKCHQFSSSVPYKYFVSTEYNKLMFICWTKNKLSQVRVTKIVLTLLTVIFCLNTYTCKSDFCVQK